MINLCSTIFFIVGSIIQIINGNYGFAIAGFLLAGLTIFEYLIDRNEETKEAFEKFAEIFFEIYGKNEKK